MGLFSLLFPPQLPNCMKKKGSYDEAEKEYLLLKGHERIRVHRISRVRQDFLNYRKDMSGARVRYQEYLNNFAAFD